MISKLIILIVFSFSLTSCSDHHFLGEFDNINTSDAIKGMITNCAKDVSKNGLQSKLKYFSHDINSFWILNQTDAPLQNYNAYNKNWGNKNKLLKYEVEEISMQVFTYLRKEPAFTIKFM